MNKLHKVIRLYKATNVGSICKIILGSKDYYNMIATVPKWNLQVKSIYDLDDVVINIHGDKAEIYTLCNPNYNRYKIHDTINSQLRNLCIEIETNNYEPHNGLSLTNYSKIDGHIVYSNKVFSDIVANKISDYASDYKIHMIKNKVVIVTNPWNWK